ncbi:MAG: VCBS repeat-containing protein [Lewinella sp.]|nr:VCBS repeat-containing protein [Lewinella sp.]
MNVHTPHLTILLITATLMVLASACESTGEKPWGYDPDQYSPLFERVDPAVSGIDFVNVIEDTYELNYLVNESIYQGAGVGVGDFNQDGLPDLVFCGNAVPEKLYINEGNLTFSDRSAGSGLDGGDTWTTGVAIGDVNNDGWPDIYLCSFVHDEPQRRRNLLFINNGDLTFSEQGRAYGVADLGYSVTANFLDYDKDGALNLYVANQPPTTNTLRRELNVRQDYQYTDRLYRNEGNGKFTDVTVAAGVRNYSYSLSATVADLNNDGWPDIYVACDYEEPDFFYLNNGDGTFSNIADRALRHMSNFSMGADIADINNDGWLDIYTADMVAADNYRLKANMSGMNPEKFWNLANNGYHFQYMYNALQLNRGNGLYSEIAQLAGVSNTDWSWAPLLADFDNDGWKDLFVTNGLLRDVRNNDFRNNIKAHVQQQVEAGATAIDPLEILNLAPSVKLENPIYRNNGDLTFSQRNQAWGLTATTWSNGAAYADFDGDGDLDLVLNNINEKALLFENRATDMGSNHFLRVLLEGEGSQARAHGARVVIEYQGQRQVQELSPSRGYMSQSEAALHFGLGATTLIDQLTVYWPNGQATALRQVDPDQTLVIKQSQADQQLARHQAEPTLFTPVDAPDFTHRENTFNDFEREVLLPHRMSRLGPCLATADVNGDGREDVFVGGAGGQAGALFLQSATGTFQMSPDGPGWMEDAGSEDTGALFFDADGDEDQDLYVVSGGNEWTAGASQYQDRLYLNDGTGQFTRATNSLPDMPSSGSCARAADMDQDGDLDLFVGGRQVPGRYGEFTRSYVLRNEGGRFTDVTAEAAPWLAEPNGMVTDAIWTDQDGDGDQDLIVVGEWMPIRLFLNDNGQLSPAEAPALEASSGWWNTISAADLDGDGDEDYIVGNLGLNIKYKASPEAPFRMYVNDFDHNGTHDVYLAYAGTDGSVYPVRGRECSSQQLPYIKEQFPTYDEFAKASVEEVLGEKIEGARYREVQQFASVILINEGPGQLRVQALPIEAQVAPIFGIAIRDWNGDQRPDILVAGNYYEREVETTRSDAGIGCLLISQPDGSYQPNPPAATGLQLYQDVRDLVLLRTANGQLTLLVANNNAALQAYRLVEDTTVQ